MAIRIYSWNVNGIRAVLNKGAFQSFMAEHQPDILCLQETKAQPGQAQIDLPEYTEYWNSAAKPGYSGVAIFSKNAAMSIVNGLPEDIVAEFGLTEDGYGDPNGEGRVIAAEFEQFWLVSVYTPNSKPDLSRLDLRYNHWDPAFLAYIKRLEKTKPVIFCGDLNVAHQEIDLADPKRNEKEHGFTKEERQRFQDFLDAGLIDTFRSMHPDETGTYTWWTHWANARARNMGWRIDYFVMSESLRPKLKSADIYAEVIGSDHCPVSIELDE